MAGGKQQDLLQGFLDAIGEDKDSSDLETRLVRRLKTWGFDHFCYLAVGVPGSDRGTAFRTNYLDSWTTRYTERRYVEVDPVVLRARTTTLPFTWGPDTEGAPTDRRALQMFDEAQAAGIRNGASIPIHEHGLHFAILTATTEAGERDFKGLCQAHGHQLHLLAHYFHDGARADFFENDEPGTLHLTVREHECLLWTARGKSAWAIGEILGISERTVVFHLANAMRKLGVSNKIYAVVKAIMAGLIAP